MTLPLPSSPAAIAPRAPRACINNATIMAVFTTFHEDLRLRRRAPGPAAVRRPGDAFVGDRAAADFGCGARRCACRQMSAWVLRDSRAAREGLARMPQNAVQRLERLWESAIEANNSRGAFFRRGTRANFRNDSGMIHEKSGK
jgi:hypothetical protein